MGGTSFLVANKPSAFGLRFESTMRDFLDCFYLGVPLMVTPSSTRRSRILATRAAAPTSATRTRLTLDTNAADGLVVS